MQPRQVLGAWKHQEYFKSFTFFSFSQRGHHHFLYWCHWGLGFCKLQRSLLAPGNLIQPIICTILGAF